jgi:hypothetical protein
LPAPDGWKVIVGALIFKRPSHAGGRGVHGGLVGQLILGALCAGGPDAPFLKTAGREAFRADCSRFLVNFRGIHNLRLMTFSQRRAVP